MKNSVWILTFILVGLASLIWAEPDDGKLAKRVMVSEGHTRTPFAIVVGSQTNRSPYTVTSESRTNRCHIIQNPSANFHLMVGTWSAFTDTDLWFFVNKGSGSWTDCAHQTYWLRYPPGGATETVRGVLLQE